MVDLHKVHAWNSLWFKTHTRMKKKKMFLIGWLYFRATIRPLSSVDTIQESGLMRVSEVLNT